VLGGSVATGEGPGVPKKERRKMRKVAFRFGLTLAAIALALPMMAKTDKPSKTESKPKSATLTLDAPVKFGSTMVNAGTYKLVIDNDKATVENGKQTIASVAGHWQEGKQKADATGFEATNGQVDQIFLRGESNTFVVSGGEVSKN
jgi:hypothetical protein